MTQTSSPLPIVLIVEDQALIRMTATYSFEDGGFEVVEAQDAAEALAFLATRKDIEVLFTDVDMPPGINGFHLAHQARLTHPKLVVMVVSGRQSPIAGGMPTGGHFSEKPYQGTAMVARAREMMAAA